MYFCREGGSFERIFEARVFGVVEEGRVLKGADGRWRRGRRARVIRQKSMVGGWIAVATALLMPISWSSN